MHTRLSLSVVEKVYMRGAVVYPHRAEAFTNSIRDVEVMIKWWR